ncbi:MAG: hypothetical protein EA356_06000 [Geminicoccaceae bacterium]|nr:MAG: hypothetical protein EA356_06000 [Geminicoccaceae bacterium]
MSNFDPVSDAGDGGVAALRRCLSPQLAALGITRVADLTDLDHIGIPVFGAIRPWSRSFAVTQGKGLDADAAWLGAVMEALELRAAEAPLTLAAKPERTDLAVWLPPSVTAFDGPWLQARCWATGAPWRVPAGVVQLDLTRPSGLRGWRRTSTGLGAHTRRTEAVRHALLEVVERHALGLARTNPRDVHLIDGGRPRCGRLGALLDRLAGLGLPPRLYRLATVAGLVTVKARLASAAPSGAPVFGSAADVDLERAALRAVLECIQSRVTRLAGARDDLTQRDYAADEEAALLVGLAAQRGHAAWPTDAPTATRDLAEADAIVARLAEAGLGPVLVVDLASGSPDVRVVKVLAVGLADSFAAPRMLAA